MLARRQPDRPASTAAAQPCLAVLLKGYPRLSETFIAQELLGLERRGFRLQIWSLRHPTDRYVHPMHRQIAASTHYLPEYLHHAPLRVLRGLAAGLRRPAMGALLRLFWRDLVRDPSPNRMRRLGQALVLARELDGALRHIHVHFLHTPASVARYAALLTGRTWSFSAHAKDIWTGPDWEKREKIADAAFGVTCTAAGRDRLAALVPAQDAAKVALVYHGLDFSRFPPPAARAARNGTVSGDPVVLLSVGRAVAKKGYADLLDALAQLPSDLDWRFVHVGSGFLLDDLKARAATLGIAGRIEWMGGQPQEAVIERMRAADLFVLPSREGDAGDRDGLPNVLMEAATQRLAIVATDFAAIPEFIRHDVEGLLVPSADPTALGQAIARAIRSPELRDRLGEACHARVHAQFSFVAGLDTIESRLRAMITA